MMKLTTRLPLYILIMNLILLEGMMNKAWANKVLLVETLQIQEQATYALTRNFVGRVEADRVSRLGFELNGVLKTLLKDEGDAVSAGDVLAQLDTQKLQARKTEINANIVQAKAGLRLAEASLKRVTRIAKQKLIDQQALDEARESRDSAKARLAQAQASLQSIEVDIEKSTLKAPYSGIIIKRHNDEGDVVAAGQNILQLQENTRHLARIGISNHLADGFTKGQSLDLMINGVNTKAKIKTILPIRNPSVRTVDVIFTLKDSNARPGDLVTWRLQQTINEPGFWIPLTALTEGARGLWNIYIVDTEGKAKLRMIEILHQTSEQAYVRGLINDGETIISSGTQRIVPNQEVLVPESNTGDKS